MGRKGEKNKYTAAAHFIGLIALGFLSLAAAHGESVQNNITVS